MYARSFSKLLFLQLVFSLFLSTSATVSSVFFFLPNKISLITLNMVRKINLTHFVKISNPYDHRSAERTAKIKIATRLNKDMSAASTKRKHTSV